MPLCPVCAQGQERWSAGGSRGDCACTGGCRCGCTGGCRGGCDGRAADAAPEQCGCAQPAPAGHCGVVGCAGRRVLWAVPVGGGSCGDGARTGGTRPCPGVCDAGGCHSKRPRHPPSGPPRLGSVGATRARSPRTMAMAISHLWQKVKKFSPVPCVQGMMPAARCHQIPNRIAASAPGTARHHIPS